MQEAVGAVRRGAARVVAHADGEDRVLARRDGHAGPGRDLQDDQAEAGRDGVGEPGEGGVLAVAAQQFGVLGVAGGQQLGLEAEGDEPGGVGRVRRGDGGRRGRGPVGFVGGGGPVCDGLAPRVGVLCAVVAHDTRSSVRKVLRKMLRVGPGRGGRAVTAPPSGPPPCRRRRAGPCPR